MPSFTSLQLLNLIQTTFLLGVSLSMSLISIPSILLSPSPILAIRQWHTQFSRTKAIGTTLSASELILSLILTYASSIDIGRFSQTTILYGISSVLSSLIFPFTMYYLQPLNEILHEKERAQRELHYADLPEKDAGMQTARDHDKIAKWAWFNWFRVAAYAGVVAVNSVAVLGSLSK